MSERLSSPCLRLARSLLGARFAFFPLLSLSLSGLEYKFLRENLMKAEVAQLDRKGNLIHGKRIGRRQKKGMAQTYTVTWQDAESKASTTLPITEYGLGRKVREGLVTLKRNFLIPAGN